MLERFFYIEYQGRNTKYHIDGRFQLAFVVGKLYLFLLPSLFLLHKLYQKGILDWYKYFDYSGTTRVSTILISFVAIYVYCYVNFFRKKKTSLILQKYRGKYKTLINHSLLFSLSTFIALPLLLVLIIDLFFKLL